MERVEEQKSGTGGSGGDRGVAVGGGAFPITMGIALGLLVSVIPLTFHPICLALLIAAYVGFRWSLSRPPVMGRRGLLLGVALLTVVVCYLLPVKILDRPVPPLSYPRMSLTELSSRLYHDHHLICRVYDDKGRDEMIQFSTDDTLSQREVMERLAVETGRELVIGYCGTMGSSILFGGYPSFTTLREKRK